MFKCVECGTEFEIKPDYCDCGNDIFEEIKNIAKNGVNPSNVKKEFHKTPEIKVISKQSVRVEKVKSFDEQYPEFSRLKKSLDPISLIIFILCLVLSGIVVAFVGNPEDKIKSSDNETPKNEQISQNIPSVDDFWDNTPPVIEQNMKKEIQSEEENQIKDPVKMIEDFLKKTEVQEPPVEHKQPVQTQAVKPVTVQPPKTNAIQKNNTQQVSKKTQPVTNSAAKPVVNMPSSPQDKATKDLLARIQKNAQASSQNSQAAKKSSVVQSNKSVHTTVNSAPSQAHVQSQVQAQTQTQTAKPVLRQKTEIPVKSSAELKQELNAYKASLRNTLGKKINFANVVGDGNCSVTFKINSSGKLIERKFSQQSSNITLNDAVYLAMMSTPTFNAPPEGYKNETLTFSVKFYNGNFEISLN
ncbi:TonB C-terminal domain-containing protein [bacterium]|nr:TonB C-terminal domain-containing protein [bacterium]